eukprot:13833-Heterococcus_DN1.PRE.1
MQLLVCLSQCCVKHVMMHMTQLSAQHVGNTTAATSMSFDDAMQQQCASLQATAVSTRDQYAISPNQFANTRSHLHRCTQFRLRRCDFSVLPPSGEPDTRLFGPSGSTAAQTSLNPL